MNINCVWVGNNLSIMERLSIILAQKAGFNVVLWTNSNLTNIPPHTIVKPLPEDIVPPSPFEGLPMPNLPNLGIGSYSQWSDYFAFKILENTGGYWMQLDLAILDKINIAQDYAFTQWGPRISPVFMKIPKNSSFCQKMVKDLEPIIETNFKGHDWHHSMLLMYTNAQKYNVFDNCLIVSEGYIDCGGQTISPYNTSFKNKSVMIHWSNATNNTNKNIPIIGSEYYNLCRQNNLI